MNIFITGGTGYMGKRLIQMLSAKGHEVVALVRKESEHKLPVGIKKVIANPFDAQSFQNAIPRGAVFVQLLGVPHPSPRKKHLFRQIDLQSVKASADAAAAARCSHFVYVSVAMMESGIMKDYQQVRREGEAYILAKGLKASFIRPWYVLGPGHWWPILLLPLYGIAALVPSLQKKARAFALVTIAQMLQTLVKTIESTPVEKRIIEIPQIKNNQSL